MNSQGQISNWQLRGLGIVLASQFALALIVVLGNSKGTFGLSELVSGYEECITESLEEHGTDSETNPSRALLSATQNTYLSLHSAFERLAWAIFGLAAIQTAFLLSICWRRSK